MTFRGFLASVVVVCGAAAAPAASAQSAVFFDSRASFLAALAGIVPQVQDFSGFANGTSLAGVAVLPGLVAESPFPMLTARLGSGVEPNMFGAGGSVRASGGGYYEFLNSFGYTALGFDIEFWDPATSGASAMLSFASGGPITWDLTATNATESTPVFFGFIASTAFASLRLNEPFEVGSIGNEEVAIDNIAGAVITPVPEPATVALMGAGLMMAGVAARRQRRARDQAG